MSSNNPPNTPVAPAASQKGGTNWTPFVIIGVLVALLIICVTVAGLGAIGLWLRDQNTIVAGAQYQQPNSVVVDATETPTIAPPITQATVDAAVAAAVARQASSAPTNAAKATAVPTKAPVATATQAATGPFSGLVVDTTRVNPLVDFNTDDPCAKLNSSVGGAAVNWYSTQDALGKVIPFSCKYTAQHRDQPPAVKFNLAKDIVAHVWLHEWSTGAKLAITVVGPAVIDVPYGVAEATLYFAPCGEYPCNGYTPKSADPSHRGKWTAGILSGSELGYCSWVVVGEKIPLDCDIDPTNGYQKGPKTGAAPAPSPSTANSAAPSQGAAEISSIEEVKAWLRSQSLSDLKDVANGGVVANVGRRITLPRCVIMQFGNAEWARNDSPSDGTYWVEDERATFYVAPGAPNCTMKPAPRPAARQVAPQGPKSEAQAAAAPAPVAAKCDTSVLGGTWEHEAGNKYSLKGQATITGNDAWVIHTIGYGSDPGLPTGVSVTVNVATAYCK